MKEQWKHIKGLNIGYEVSNMGNVREDFGDRYQLKKLSRSGKYLVLNACGKRLQVHVLVAEAFVDKPDTTNKLIVVHLDGDVDNNCASNLKWVESTANIKSIYSIKLMDVTTNIGFNSYATAAAYYGLPIAAIQYSVTHDSAILGHKFKLMDKSDYANPLKLCITVTTSQVVEILNNMVVYSLEYLQHEMEKKSLNLY